MIQTRRPSDDLATLGAQLRQSLDELDDEDAPGDRDFRRYLRHVVSFGWRAAAEHDSQLMREVIELLRDARPVVDDALPRLKPRQTAAVEMQQMLSAFYVGEDELREFELEAKLADHGRQPAERAVLQALARAEEPLRQKQVWKLMAENERPGPARVGQILRKLYDHSYLRRHKASAPGGSEVAHYFLAPKGSARCRELGLIKRPSRQPETPVVSSEARKNERLVRLMQSASSSRDPRKMRVLAAYGNALDQAVVQDLVASGNVSQVSYDDAAAGG